MNENAKTYIPPFTTEELEAKVREIAAANPDFVYADQWGVCYYAATLFGEKVGWEHGCIVGRALHALDPALQHNESGELVVDGERFFLGVSYLLEKMGLPDSGFLIDVQQGQDDGLSWGKAVENAQESAQKCGGVK